MTLITYRDKRKAKDGRKIDSIRAVIERWAPPRSDNNNCAAYAKSVAAAREAVDEMGRIWVGTR